MLCFNRRLFQVAPIPRVVDLQRGRSKRGDDGTTSESDDFFSSQPSSQFAILYFSTIFSICYIIFINNILRLPRQYKQIRFVLGENITIFFMSIYKYISILSGIQFYQVHLENTKLRLFKT